MASPDKSEFRALYRGSGSSRIVYPSTSTVQTTGLHSGFFKVYYGASEDSNGFTPTDLYRETTTCGNSANRRRTRGRYIDYTPPAKYVYYYNSGFDNAISAGTKYSRSWLPGYRCYYNHATKKSLTKFDAPTVARLNKRILAGLGKASLDMGVILVEMKDTVNWISKRSGQLIDGLVAAKRGDLPKMGRVLGFNPKKLKNWNVFRNQGRNPSADALSSLILETNFAIRPLISDISDAVDLFIDPQHNIFRGRIRTAMSNNYTETNEWTYRKQEYQEKMADLHRVVVNYRIRDPDLIARKALGLTSNPATAWEAVPYSWLVDYVIDVGDFLAETVATQGLVFLSGTTSRKIDVKTTVKYKVENGSTGEFDRRSCKYKTEAYRRDTMETFPSPSLSFVFDDLTVNKALNVAALLQKLRR